MEDLKDLRLLSIFHYIVGGLTGLFSCMFLIHLFIGLTVLLSPESMTGGNGEAPPEFFGYIFTFVGGLFFILGVTLAGFIIYSGTLLKKQQRRMFSFVVACIECIFMPFGTILGVFTIIVLSRDSVKKIYGEDVNNPSNPAIHPTG
jgi:hypothetical protein